MTYVNKFKRQRGLPAEAGVPSLFFTPWNFSRMLPLRTLPYTITLTTSMQSYMDVVLPANTWADDRLLVVKAQITQEVKTPNHVGGPTYQEAYTIGSIGTINRGAAHGMIPTPSTSKFFIDRTFIKPPNNIILELNYDIVEQFAVSSPDGLNHQLPFTPVTGAFDPTIDNVLQFLISTNYATSTDTVEVVTAQAFIQAPYNLRRLG